MKQHTQDFKEEIKLIGKQQDIKITYGNTTLTSDEINSVTPSYEGNLLKSIMRQLNIDSNENIPAGTEIGLKYGLWVNGVYEYIDFGKYIVKEIEKQEDTGSYLITCYDKLLYSMKSYEKMNITYPISVRDYLRAICNHLGLAFRDSNFGNSNKMIQFELYLDSDGNDIGYTFRDVLDEIAQVAGGVICINANDEVEVRYINDTNDTIDEEYLKDVNVNFGEKYGPINSIVLSRAGESDNVYLQNEASVAQNGLCELKIVDNQIMKFNDRSDYLPELLDRLNGIEYYLNDFTSTGIIYYDLLDRYNVKIGDNIYSCLMLNDEVNITQGLEELIYTDMPETSETDYTKADKTDRRINQTYIIVDKQNQQIESVISQTDEQNEKINRVVQTVDELNSKISDVADITTSKDSNNGVLEFESINESEPIRVEIRPISENISYLYPRNNLFPSNNLYPKARTLRFTNTETGEVSNYELPSDLLYYDSENYDEFILDYDSQTCLVNKRVAYNADGTTYVLATPTTIDYEYPIIPLTDGDYKVELVGYNVAYLFVRLMSQNIYTTQFATKAEVQSQLSQTSNSILAEVNADITTLDQNIDREITNINAKLELKINSDELISEINASADVIRLDSNRLIIDSDNFKLSEDGVIDAVAGEVGGFELSETEFSGSLNGIYNYDYFDARLVMCMLMEYISENDILFDLCDANDNGILDSADMYKIIKIINGTEINNKEITGDVKIDSKDPKECLSISKDGEKAVSIGIGGINSNLINAENIICGTTDANNNHNFNGVTINSETGEINLIKDNNVESQVTPEKIVTPHIIADNIQTGIVTITPVANTPTHIYIEFVFPYENTPRVVATPVTEVPGTTVRNVGVKNITTQGFDLYVTRTNTIDTVVNWIAID